MRREVTLEDMVIRTEDLNNRDEEAGADFRNI